jgi:hypothetical protein
MSEAGPPTGRSLEQRLQELLDKEEIRQAMYSYARGTDRCHRELIEGAYHDDAWDDHGNFQGGRDAVADIIASNRAGATNSMHHLGNILIELLDDAANVAYFMACQTLEHDGKTYTRLRAGRYLDRFERRDGRWRIARRMVIDDWSRLDELVAVAPSITPECKQGSRDATDASYQLSDFTRVFPETP